MRNNYLKNKTSFQKKLQWNQRIFFDIGKEDKNMDTKKIDVEK